MHEQPLHRGVRVTVSCSQKRLLAADCGETHTLKLCHGLCIELGKSRRFLSFRELGFTRLETTTKVSVKLEDVIGGNNDRNVYLEINGDPGNIMIDAYQA